MNHQIKLLTIRQGAKLVEGLSEYHIRKLIKANLLPHIRSGNRVLIEKQAIYDYVSHVQH